MPPRPANRFVVTAATVATVASLTLGASAPAAADPIETDDSRPAGWIARATPGAGYSWDTEDRCAVQGAVFAGGFEVSHAVAPGFLVGGAIALHVNTLAPCTDDGPRLGLSMVVGPAIDWYPVRDVGLHVVAAVGYAEVEAGDAMERTGRGVGAIGALGHDWVVGHRNGATARIGVQLRVTVQHTFTELARHTLVTPTLLATFSFD